MGSIYRRGRIYWIKFYRNGQPMRESSESDKESDARQLLKLREGDVARGVPVSPRANRITLGELFDAVLEDYRQNGMKSIDDAKARIRLHLAPFFGHRRAATLTTADVRRYITVRKAEPDCRGLNRKKREREEENKPRAIRYPANGQINRELTMLKRAYNLAVKDGILVFKPHIPMLEERGVRVGFFERDQFLSIHGQLPEYLKGFALFAFITGWRKGEIQSLQWRQVDFDAGQVCLEVGTTKNDDARVFFMTAELRLLLEAQWRLHQQIKKAGKVCPYVFHRKGLPVGDFRKAWKTACTKAGLAGRIPHDFRRTAVRNLVRAGIPERVAMKMTGHRTRSVFERYNIVSQGDLKDAARRLESYLGVMGTITGTND